MSTYESVFAAANALPSDQRAQLIDALWTAESSLLSEAWSEEIQRRSEQIDADDVTPVPWKTIYEEVRVRGQFAELPKKR